MSPDTFAAAQALEAEPPRISVIVPSFNSGAFLRQALGSALDQVPCPLEVVVQDGGSTDETLDILRSFGERVAWVSAPDEGQSDALNRALARATGDIVLWLNADDVILPGALAAASAAFVADPSLAFAYGDFNIIDGAGDLVRRFQSSPYSWDKVFAGGCYIFSGSLFVRRQTLTELGGYDASLHACMDFDLMLRLGAAGSSRHLGRTIAQLRMHDENKSSTIRTVFLREGFRVRRRYAGRSPRLWFHTFGFIPLTAILLATAPLRYSPRWPRHGRGKTL
jgi:glycosyltransferase involved in cell wall biosynthesis